MAHRTPKINDTVKFTDQQQAILNDAVEQLMEAGGLTALTQAHFNEAQPPFSRDAQPLCRLCRSGVFLLAA